MSAQKIRVFLKHHNKPEFAPEESRCETDTAKNRRGCGASIWFYRTYPKEKRMPFDGPVHVVEGTQATLGDGGVVAYVLTDNTHFASCPHYGNNAARQAAKAPAPAAAPRDAGQRASNDHTHEHDIDLAVDRLADRLVDEPHEH